MNGLSAIIKSFSNITNKISKKVFVFVTPFKGKLNSSQPIRNAENKAVKRIDKDLEGLEQYVYKYKFHSAREK